MRTFLFTFLALGLAGQPGLADELSEHGFAADTLAIYADADPGAKPIGKLLVAAPLTALGAAQDGLRRVAVTGWTQAGAERVLQAAPGLRVSRAALANAGLDALSFGAARTDPDTGLVWTFTTLTAWIDADSAVAPNLETLWAEAEPLFSTRCTACHVRRVPPHYTANQWTSHLKVMGPRTGLPKGDQELIRVFLQYHSADAATLADPGAQD